MSTELVTTGTPTAVEVSYANTGAAKIREAAEVMALCKSLADAVCHTGMMPKHLRGKPEETAAVMLYGATLDLDPMQSVRSIYEVHGQPGLYGRAMVALIIGRGHEVWTVSTSDEAVTVAGRRKGSQHIEEVTWTIERATRAGYVPVIDPQTGKYQLNRWGKLDGNEKYLTDPQSMLYAKAASEVCRKVAPDVLAGVYAVEDLESERWEVEQVARPIPAVGASNQLRAALGTPDPSPAPDPSRSEPEPDDAAPAGGPAQDVEPASAGEDSPHLNTRGALAKRMFATLNDAGITDRNERLAEVSAIVGRTITASAQMTDAEAEAVIATLEVRAQSKPPVDVTDAEVLPDSEDGA